MLISDWSSDGCSSDLERRRDPTRRGVSMACRRGCTTAGWQQDQRARPPPEAARTPRGRAGDTPPAIATSSNPQQPPAPRALRFGGPAVRDKVGQYVSITLVTVATTKKTKKKNI